MGNKIKNILLKNKRWIILFICLVVFIKFTEEVFFNEIIKTIKNKYASVKTVKAVVVDKHKIETFSKYSGNGKNEKYVVVFSVNGKKKSFYVSQFSYGGYRINEKGMLKYKGDNLIGFN